LVSQQQYIPKKARGGRAGGLTEINEGDRGEIVNLPDNSLVIPHDISRQIADSVGGVSRSANVFNVSFKGAQINDNMSLRKITNHVIGEMGRQFALET
jgi:phage-related protein